MHTVFTWSETPGLRELAVVVVVVLVVVVLFLLLVSCILLSEASDAKLR